MRSCILAAGTHQIELKGQRLREEHGGEDRCWKEGTGKHS